MEKVTLRSVLGTLSANMAHVVNIQSGGQMARRGRHDEEYVNNGAANHRTSPLTRS